MSPSTKLEAVNEMLACIGQAPVTTLSGTTSSDVSMAVTTLDSIVRRVQTDGWAFNTNQNVTLSYSGGAIALGSDVARVEFDPASTQGKILCIRSDSGTQKVYDSYNHTFDIGGNIIASKVVYYLEFADMPASAREYILIRAARVFADRVQGDQAVHAYTAIEEAHAKRLFERDQSLTSNANMLSAPDTIDIVSRSPRIGGARWGS